MISRISSALSEIQSIRNSINQDGPLSNMHSTAAPCFCCVAGSKTLNAFGEDLFAFSRITDLQPSNRFFARFFAEANSILSTVVRNIGATTHAIPLRRE